MLTPPVSPAAIEYADHVTRCPGWRPCGLCEHLAARMAAEADDELDEEERMPKYRKKPVVIEAAQWWPGKTIEGVVQRPARDVPSRAGGIAFTEPPRWVIETLEGDMTVSPGDWVITGVKGERYPCKPDIFEATYEAVDRAADALNHV